MVNDSFRKSIHSKEHVALRELWIAKRKALNLSQRQLAERLNVIYSLVGKIETGDRRLDTVETIEYCRALEVDPMEVTQLLENLLK
tara:strand:+ start:541 stop:798 length:258 start_codon:yes stop_codon:yes gene_type:complete